MARSFGLDKAQMEVGSGSVWLFDRVGSGRLLSRMARLVQVASGQAEHLLVTSRRGMASLHRDLSAEVGVTRFIT